MSVSVRLSQVKTAGRIELGFFATVARLTDDTTTGILTCFYVYICICARGRLGSRVVSVLDSGAEGPGFKSQSRRCRVTVLGKLFTPIVPLFTTQRNW